MHSPAADIVRTTPPPAHRHTSSFETTPRLEFHTAALVLRHCCHGPAPCARRRGLSMADRVGAACRCSRARYRLLPAADLFSFARVAGLRGPRRVRNTIESSWLADST